MTVRAVKQQNGLPEYVACSLSLEIFKQAGWLSKVLKNLTPNKDLDLMFSQVPFNYVLFLKCLPNYLKSEFLVRKNYFKEKDLPVS